MEGCQILKAQSSIYIYYTLSLSEAFACNDFDRNKRLLKFMINVVFWGIVLNFSVSHLRHQLQALRLAF